MKTLLLIALGFSTALTAAVAIAQVQPPAGFQSRDRMPIQAQVRPTITNGAICLADAGTPLSLYALNPSVVGRDLSGSVTGSLRMTNDVCRATCASQNFVYAGTQSGSFCFCGNSAGAHGTGICGAACTGNHLEICGGSVANSVSYTGASGVAVPTWPQPPSNGGQCTLNVTGPAYFHFELQQWQITGPPTMGQLGKQYPMRWTVSGTGGSQALTVSGKDSQRLIRAWTISGSSNVTYVATLQAANVYFHEWQGSGSGTLQENPQTQFIDGVQQVSKTQMTTTAAWAEHQHPVTIAPNQGVLVAAPTGVPVTDGSPYGYARPGGSPGTITCSWNVTL